MVSEINLSAKCNGNAACMDFHSPTLTKLNCLGALTSPLMYIEMEEHKFFILQHKVGQGKIVYNAAWNELLHVCGATTSFK